MMSLVNLILRMYEVAPSWTITLGLSLAATIGGFGVYFIYKNKRNTSDNTPFLYTGIVGAILSVISAAMIWSAFKGMAELP